MNPSPLSQGIVLFCSMVAAGLSACGRTTMVKRTHDAGSSPGRDTPPDRSPDIDSDAPGPVVDAAVNRREAGPDTRPESPPDAGPFRCTPFASTTTLADLGNSALSSTLLVDGDMLFVATATVGIEPSTPVRSIVAYSLSTRISKTFPLGNVMPTSLASGDNSIFYLQGKAIPFGASGWSFTYPDVARLDLATGQVSVIDHEVLPLGFTISPVAGNADGEIVWSMQTAEDGSAAVIRRWDRAAASAKTVMTVNQLAGLFADTDRLYWSRVGAGGVIGFHSAPLSGGAVTTHAELPYDTGGWGGLVAVDSGSFFFLRPNSALGTLFSIPKQGGDSRPLLKDANAIAVWARSMDDTHVYWIDYSDQTQVRRVAKTGGKVEHLPVEGTGPIADLVVDPCNLYWIGAGGTRLMAKAK